jgi:hypothetical protein
MEVGLYSSAAPVHLFAQSVQGIMHIGMLYASASKYRENDLNTAGSVPVVLEQYLHVLSFHSPALELDFSRDYWTTDCIYVT